MRPLRRGRHRLKLKVGIKLIKVRRLVHEALIELQYPPVNHLRQCLHGSIAEFALTCMARQSADRSTAQPLATQSVERRNGAPKHCKQSFAGADGTRIRSCFGCMKSVGFQVPIVPPRLTAWPIQSHMAFWWCCCVAVSLQENKPFSALGCMGSSLTDGGGWGTRYFG
jgi:hypothetical protein